MDVGGRGTEGNSERERECENIHIVVKLSLIMQPNITQQFCGLSVKCMKCTADWSLCDESQTCRSSLYMLVSSI